jgi:ferritin-like metal-binding protein YciE
MPLTRIRELYVANLSDLYGAEEEILRQLPLLSALAADPALREVFDTHYRDTQRHMARLISILEQLDERRRHAPAPAIRGLIEEARVRQEFLERGELLDLALVDAGRRIEHYEMAAYSITSGYAFRLGHTDAANLLLETLKEERQADNQLEMLTAPTRVTAA